MQLCFVPHPIAPLPLLHWQIVILRRREVQQHRVHVVHAALPPRDPRLHPRCKAVIAVDLTCRPVAEFSWLHAIPVRRSGAPK